MSRYEWLEGMHRPYTHDTLLRAIVNDDVEIELNATLTGGSLNISFEVFDRSTRTVFTTDSTAWWPQIEKFIPREEWPIEIWAGTHGPKERHPDPEVVAAIQRSIQRFREWLELD